MDNIKDVSFLIRQLQANHKDIFLCGSAALILKGVLPNRPINDIDFVSSDVSVIKELSLWPDIYSGIEKDDQYVSYSGFTKYSNVKINILLFKKNQKFNLDVVKSNYGDIVCQDIDDIIAWKQTYNRKKDLIDLDNIAANMLEKAIFTK
jgi:hypothetical protein